MEKKNKFINLIKKYPYNNKAIGFIFTLNNTVKPYIYPCDRCVCVTINQIDEFIKDMLLNELFFSEKQTKAKTAAGMKRYLKKLFINN